MKVILHDTSVLLNLLAAERLIDIVEATGWEFAICPAVRDEAKRLRDAQTGEMVDVEIEPLIAEGHLQVLELCSVAEQTLYVEQACAVDDGEAMSIAIAASRQLELAIDDKQATNHTRRRFPEIRLWATPDILKHWADLKPIDPTTLSIAIRLIESRARYFPSPSHTLHQWWCDSREKV